MPNSRLAKWKATCLPKMRENEFLKSSQDFCNKSWFEITVPLKQWRCIFTDTRCITLALPLMKERLDLFWVLGGGGSMGFLKISLSLKKDLFFCLSKLKDNEIIFCVLEGCKPSFEKPLSLFTALNSPNWQVYGQNPNFPPSKSSIGMQLQHSWMSNWN